MKVIKTMDFPYTHTHTYSLCSGRGLEMMELIFEPPPQHIIYKPLLMFISKSCPQSSHGGFTFHFCSLTATSKIHINLLQILCIKFFSENQIQIEGHTKKRFDFFELQTWITHMLIRDSMQKNAKPMK